MPTLNRCPDCPHLYDLESAALQTIEINTIQIENHYMCF